MKAMSDQDPADEVRQRGQNLDILLKRCDRISLMKMAKMTGRTEAKIFSELMAIVLRMTRSTSARCVGLPNTI